MRIAKGQFYKLYNEDNIKALQSMPDNCVDSIVTDPPYGMSKEPDVYEMIKGWYKHGHYDHVSKKGFMGKCYHPDTEILTPKGWYNISKLNKGDPVYTRDLSGNLVTEHISKTYEYDFTGKLLHIKHRSAEQLVTPNHKVYAKNKGAEYDLIDIQGLSATFHMSNQITPKYKLYKKDYIKFNGKKYNTKYFMLFLGMFLGDGYTLNREKEYRIGFFFSKERKIDLFERVISNLPITYNKNEVPDRNGFSYNIHDKGLYNKLYSLGKAESKYIPNFIFNLDPYYLKYLYEGLIKTDGHLQGKNQQIYYTVSKQLADDFQHLCFLLGKSATMSIKKGGHKVEFPNGQTSIAKTAYVLSILQEEKHLYCEKKNIGKVPYKGKVNCIELQNHHVLLTRYNNKSVWSGNSWDAFVPQPAFWKEVYRVLKPGGHVISFFSNRTYDIGTLAIRMAGFEIRDQIDWLYGNGFPKSQNVSKALDAHHGKKGKVVGRRSHPTLKDKSKVNRQGKQQFHGKNSIKDEWDVTESATDIAKQWEGWGTALKPAKEPIVLARKPLIGTMAVNVLEHGTGAINIDDSRVAGPSWNRNTETRHDFRGGKLHANSGNKRIKTEPQSMPPSGRFPTNVILTHDYRCKQKKGHFHCHPDCPIHIIDSQSGISKSSGGKGKSSTGNLGGFNQRGRADSTGTNAGGLGDTGGASRFFYCAKPSKKEKEAGLEHFNKSSAGERVNRKEGSAGINNPRAGAGRTSSGANIHPTVKPIKLMEYLIRLVTPKNGIVLDPFMGSGSTGIAAFKVKCKFIGIERDKTYAKIARARIIHHIKLYTKRHTKETSGLLYAPLLKTHSGEYSERYRKSY